MQARKLLADDPDLAPWNIGVIVTDRVAVLWGPAPSAEISFLAEERLRKMVELVQVRNELFLSDLLEPMRLAPASQDNPRQLPPPLRRPGAMSNPSSPRMGEAIPGGPAPSPVIEVLPPEVLPDVPPKRLP